MRRLLVSAQPGELRAAWVEAGRLDGLLIRRDDQAGQAGDLYLGRVGAVDRGLEAVFLDLGLARPGFLPLAELDGPPPAEGGLLTVRILRAGGAGKGPRLSARIKDPPAGLAARAAAAPGPGRLARAADPLERLLVRPVDDILCDDPDTLAALTARLARHPAGDWPVPRLDSGPPPLFERSDLLEDGVEAAIEALLAPQVALPGGGRLWIEPTRGLSAVDVDSAGHRGARSAQALALAVDLEAAAELPRQLRLRALSGLVVVDFLALAERAGRARVVAALRAGLKRDPEPARAFPMSPSGLVEVTRRRAGPALHEILTEPCGLDAGGRRKSAPTLAFEALRAVKRAAALEPGARFALRVRPPVAAALAGPAAAAKAALEARRGRPLALETVAVPEAPAFELVALAARAGRR